MRRIVVLAWTLAAAPLALGGCHVEPSYGGKQVTCTTDADCHSQLGAGYACQPAGYCAKTGTSDGGVGDGGIGDGGIGDGGVGDGGTLGLAVTLTQPADGSYVGTPVEIHSRVTGATGTPTVTCAAGSGSPVTATDQGGDWVCSVNIDTVAEGAGVDLTVTATDTSSTPASDTVHVTRDSLPPIVSITKPTDASGFYVQQPGDLPVEATASDATLTDLVLTYVDPAGKSHPVTDCPASTTQATCSGTISLPLGSAPGDYTLQATATDAAGHNTQETVLFNIDGNGPKVVISSKPSMPVRRDRDAPFVVDVSDGHASVAKVTFTVLAAGPNRTNLDVTGTGTGAAGQTTFTVPSRAGGAAAPVLDALQGTWTVQVVATDAWGNQATTSGPLTITRVAWQADLNAGGSTTGAALSPAVSADGIVYVVRQDGTGHDTVFAIPSGSGQRTVIGTTARSVLAGPMLVEGKSGVSQLIFLETQSVTSTNFTLESLDTTGTQQWTYGGTALLGQSYPLGLPAVGSSGQLYVPVRVMPTVGNPSSCIYQVGLDGTNTGYACVSKQSWGRTRVAALRQASGDEAVAVNAQGDTLVVSCAGTCSRVSTGTPIGTPVGGPMLSADHYFLTGARPSGGPSGSLCEAFPFGANLGNDSPDWTVNLVGPSTGALREANRITGGLVGALWEARGPTSPVTPPNETKLPLPTGAPAVSLSLGTDGRRYALVSNGTSAYVVGYAGPPGNKQLWRYPAQSASSTLPPPISDTTAVLSPQGLLIVPDSKGGVTALVTDSLHPAVGWANDRADAARTAAIAR